MIKDTDLAWLAGIIDGEGNIGFENGKNHIISARVGITNTDMKMIDNIIRIYFELGISHYCNKRRRDNRADGYKRKPICNVQVHRIKEVKVLLERVIPYLINKKEIAFLMLEYCNIRIEKLDNSNCRRNAPYGLEEKLIADKVKNINIKGVIV